MVADQQCWTHRQRPFGTVTEPCAQAILNPGSDVSEHALPDMRPQRKIVAFDEAWTKGVVVRGTELCAQRPHVVVKCIMGFHCQHDRADLLATNTFIVIVEQGVTRIACRNHLKLHSSASQTGVNTVLRHGQTPSREVEILDLRGAGLGQFMKSIEKFGTLSRTALADRPLIPHRSISCEQALDIDAILLLVEDSFSS
ncbi:hypothetical protein [Rhodococcus sp. MEB064]|uniref:hypothetical protein n=1 Tax=Rhodococcus sp. MEB064 TaxID=1587522 RepID=UPI0018CE6C1C|nr:hypothetical protein [Rhodococcus sp. MEB064]